MAQPDAADLRATLSDALRSGEPLAAETLNMACFMLSQALDDLTFSTPAAAPLARRLLRMAGRLVIDTAAEGAAAEVWPNTEGMILQWMDEALRTLGYRVRPVEEGGREELPDPSAGW